MTDSAIPDRRRRRTGAVLDEAIRAAVVDLLTRSGVAAVTMEAVATRAGTSKPVLYRRWPNRAELLRDTLVPMVMDVIPHADTGSFRADMLAILKGWTAFFAELTYENGTAMPYKFTTQVRVVPEVKPFKYEQPKAPR